MYINITYNRTLPNTKQITQNHWSILKRNKAVEITFSIKPITAFRKSKSLKQLIEGNKISGKQTINMKGNVNLVNLEYGRCVVYRLLNTRSFRSQQNGRIFIIFHQVNCKSKFVIYLLECNKCPIQ